jgi:hypothetical protein
MNHFARLAVVIVLSSGLAVPTWSQSINSPSHGAASDLNRINPIFLVTPEEAQRWHTAKDLLGPALSGNPSWKVFMTIVEEKLREYGAVDLRRNTWTYDRWHTSEWPDDSKWSLTSNGKPLRVASYGANSGATAEAGVTADLVFYDPAKPPASIDGKIVVFQTTPEDEHTPADRRTYEYPGDYLYLSNPDSFPDPRIPRKTTMTVSTRAEMRQATSYLPKLLEGRAAGAVFVFEASYERLSGLYTFGVPAIHQMPTLYVDRDAGRQLLSDAKSGRKATLRLVAKVERTETYQLFAYLPGRNYGTARDEQIMLITHTDGPSISQDDGAFGILGIVRYFSRIPQSQRPRTLMLFLDNRHYMPGAERAFAKENWLDQHPEAWNPVVGLIGIEHLGQLEYVERDGVFKRTGLVEHSRLHATNNQLLIDLAIKAVKDNKLKRVSVECVDRPGIHGTSQGTWLGLGAVGRRRGLPAFATMGDMGAYWSTNARIAAFDARHFVDQVATMTQLTGELMLADLEKVKPAPLPTPASSGR